MTSSAYLVPVAALILGGLGGYLVGSGSGEQGGPVEKEGVRKTERLTTTLDGAASERNVSYGSTTEILQSPGQSARVGRLLEFYENLDPALFADEAKRIEDLPWSERLLASYLLFSRWGEEDPRGALAHADQMGFGGRFVKPTVLQAWAGEDPEGAAQYFTDNKKEFEGGGFGRRGGGQSPAEGIAKEWARKDPAAALAWSQGLDGRDARRSIEAVFSQVAQDNPAQAAEMLAGASLGEGREGAVEQIARNYGKLDPEAADAWIASLPEGERAEATREMIGGLASQDVAAAASKALSLSGDSRDGAIADVAGQMSRENPAGALEWLVENGSASAQQQGIDDVMRNLAPRDDAAAREFIASQEVGEVKDSAAAWYVFSNRSDDPVTVMNVALSIDDERRGNRAARRAAQQWLRSDETAAREFIEGSDAFSEEQRERLLR